MRLSEKRAAMMIVSVLIATLTYQATLNPPGGFWQDDKPSNASNTTVANDGHQAGTTIKAGYNGPYNAFVKCNAVGLFASLATILLLTSATTIEHPIMIWGLMLIMWVSVFSVAFSFFYGLRLIAAETMTKTLTVILLSCMGLIAIVLILHMMIGLRKLESWLQKKMSCGASYTQE
ncbi:hypothetical protein EJ110_NYTH53179 [Nymphaea thermarum]|nr:hypothetical protein EJ110_NYTH53179 [Nymphaea thermarum]